MSNIKINDVYQRIQYVAVLNQTVFAIPFPFFQNNYVFVWVNGIQLTQGLAAGQYTVTGAGSPSGGTVTLVDPSINGDIVTIEGIMPIDRTSIYSSTISNLTGSDLNGDFNREVVMMKQIQTTQSLLQLQYAPWAIISQDATVTKDRYLPLLPALGAWRMNAGFTAIETFLTPDAPGLAPSDATYLIQVANSNLPDAQAMGDLVSGFVINTASTGVQLTRELEGVADQTVITNPDGIAANPIVGIAPNPILPGTGSFIPPKGNTAQRPGSPVDGMIRYNTDDEALEVYEGSFWDPLSGGVVDLVSGFNNQITVDNTDQANPVVHIANNPVLPGTAGMTLPTGTTAQRSGALGTMRFNSQTSEFEGTTDGSTWHTFQTSAGTVLSVSGTANELDSTGGANPVLSFSATANFPGTFNIQGTTAVSAIINDNTMATASATSLATSLSIKTYIDTVAQGLTIQGACVCASTTALTVTYANGASGVGATLTNAGAQAAIQLDGVSPTVGQRVLIKNQASAFQNGIYTVTTVGTGATNWVLTRATDYDTAAEINPGDLVVINTGTTQTGSSWLQTATVATVGTDAISFSQFTAALPVGVAFGGTGKTSLTAYAIIAGGTTSTGVMQQLGLGSTGQMLQSQGSSALAAFSTATYPSVATTSGTVLRADGTNWVKSTATFADTYAVNRLLYASASNTVTGLATQASSALITDVSGVPLWSTALPAGVQANINSIGTLNTNVRLQSGLALQTDVHAADTLLLQAYDVDGAAYVTFATLTANNTPTMDLSTSVTIGGNAIGVITPWVAYTPTFNGFGTPTTIQIFSRRVGNSLQIRGNFTCGTSTAAEARMTIGFNGTNANVTSSTALVPAITTCGSGNSSFAFAGALMPLIESAVQYITFGTFQASGNGLTKRNGDVFTAAGTIISVLVDIPIQGW